MKNLFGTAIGAAIDRRDGDSGVKGAVAGYAASGLLKAITRLATFTALGLGALAIARRVRSPG